MPDLDALDLEDIAMALADQTGDEHRWLAAGRRGCAEIDLVSGRRPGSRRRLTLGRFFVVAVWGLSTGWLTFRATS